ncbi:hypothetical protein [Vibrio sp. TRT 29B02]|uniref:H-NS family histone-like protein n=1 Tax=Vibrio sp. TRT 29B02 TaxID=3418508 RepID=UPI003CF64595
MDTTLDKIMKARTLRSLCKKEGTTSTQMQAYIETMNNIALEIHEAEEAAAAAEQIKAKAIQDALAKLKEAGVTTRELVSAIDSSSTKGQSKPPKFTYIDENGNSQGWTGQGRIPIPMQKQMDEKNLPKEHFLTKNIER